MLEVAGLNVFHGNLQVVWDLSFLVGEGRTRDPDRAERRREDNDGRDNHRAQPERHRLDPVRRRGYSRPAPVRSLPGRVLRSSPRNARSSRRCRSARTSCSGGSDRTETEKTLAHIYRLFPILQEREHQQAGTLSGGEQQMLAIGRALMSKPRLLILDEPSTGLSPLLVGQVFRSLEQLGREGMTILLLEQNVRHALTMCNRGYVLENGRIIKEGKSKELMRDPHIQKAYLGF